MCGIAGVFSYDNYSPLVDIQALNRTCNHMVSRGPDASGLWVSSDKKVGLGHRRLSIIDLSELAQQPMLDPDTGNRIVFNGEIYNFVQLRSELESAGHKFFSHSDTEVLLKLYHEFGQEMLGKLRGMFAFAIWDEQKRAIFLARDPFGIKPLYFIDDGYTLRFASQVKALLTDKTIDTSMDAAGYVGYFLWGHVPEPYTLYKEIRSLEAGSYLWIDSHGKRKTSSYFRVEEELGNIFESDIRLTIPEVQEQLHSALIDSITHHLVADVPVGVFLSSGIDSATITALCKEALISDSFITGKLDWRDNKKDLSTITLGFTEYKNKKDDEVPLAEMIAQHYGTEQYTRVINKEDFESHYDSIIDHMDQPTIDGINSYFVSLAAKEAGLKVALSGLGGDELFAGYSNFKSIPRIVSWGKPISVIPHLGSCFRLIASPVLKYFTPPKYASLFEYSGDYGDAYLLKRGLFMPWELPKILDGDLVREGWSELQTLNRLRQNIQEISDDRTKISVLETAWYMRNQLLRDTDWASMAHSLEVRVPFVDVELFKTVTSLVHTGNLISKRDLASAVTNPIPANIVSRKKTGFGIPVTQWLTDKQPKNRWDKAHPSRLWAKTLIERF